MQTSAFLARRRLGVVLVLILLGWTLASCGLYHRKFEVSGDIRKDVDFVLQVDDVGKFWDSAEARNALAAIADSAKKTNTFVVVFAHGWHHNAKSSDDNLIDFQKSMVELRKRLEEPIYAESRRALSGTSDFKAIGVYLGWRGRSLPSFADYVTFWGRKSAAERVGEGDFREFMLSLHRIYESANPKIEPSQLEASLEAGKAVPFMGLVSIGHSFGGQVLLKATQPIFEANLIAADANTQRTAKATVPPDNPVKGFGDLVILVNPAAEALQFDRMDRLSRSLQYTNFQPPLLFVVSAASDSARTIWFPLGRLLDASIRADLQPEVADMWSHALGSYDKQWTHTIEIVGDPKKNWKFDPEGTYVKDRCRLVHEDLTGSFEFVTEVCGNVDKGQKEGVKMTRLNKAPLIDRTYSPFVVANVPIPERGALALIDGHSTIWKEVFTTFITNYAALTQGKNILIRRGGLERCRQTERSQQNTAGPSPK